MDDDRARARAFAADAVASGEPLRWFEKLYAAAEAGEADVPWADLRPNPHLVSWPLLDDQGPKSALVVGSGLGDEDLGLTNIAFEDYLDPEEPTVRRFRATYRRAPN